MAARREITRSWELIPISMALTIGPLAWSSSVAARPSQKSAERSPAFQTVGADRAPVWPRTPTDVARPSSPPAMRLWHELHETVPVADNRGSKKRSFPSSTLAGVAGFAVGDGAALGSGAKPPVAARATG